MKLKDEKDGDLSFTFDKVFYEDSAQASVYEVLALPIVQGESETLIILNKVALHLG